MNIDNKFSDEELEPNVFEYDKSKLIVRDEEELTTLDIVWTTNTGAR